MVLSDPDQIRRHAEDLSETGVVAIRNYLDEATCDKIYQQANDIIVNESCDVIEENRAASAKELFEWEGTVINKRSGRDAGVYDVAQIDDSIEELREFKQDPVISDIINSATATTHRPLSTHIYWKQSIVETRGPHHDSLGEKFKAFVYLTDVNTKSHGPYAYVEGSHDPSFVEKAITVTKNKMQGKAKTDSVLYDEEDATYFIAPRGTLIISNQSGVHFGVPQRESYERMLATTHYESQ